MSGTATASERSVLDLLDAEGRARVMQACVPEAFAFGQVVVREGAEADAFYVIVSGRARVVRGPPGREVVLGLLGPGESFGEIALLRGGLRTATVRASGDLTVLRLARDAFTALLRERPELATWLERLARARALFAFLKSSPALSALPAAVIQDMIAVLRPAEAAPGDVLQREGEPVEALCLVEEGRLSATRREGERKKPLGFLRAGDLFGEARLLDGQPSDVTVEATAPCRLLRLERPDFEALQARWPEFAAAASELAAVRNYKRTAMIPLDFIHELLPADAATQAPDAATTTPAAAQAPAAPGDAPRPRGRIGRFPFVAQIDEADCGVACLAMVCRHFGRKVSLTRLRELAHTATDGTSLTNLVAAAERLGLAARAQRVSREHLDALPCPALVHWKGVHWVVAVDVQPDEVRIADPARGDEWVPRAVFEASWTGFAALFDYTSDFDRAPEEQKGVGWLLPLVRPHLGVLVRCVGLASITAALGLLLPVLTQVVVDRIIVEGAVDLLGLVLLAMGAAFAFSTLSGLLQGYLLAFVAVRVDAGALDFLSRRLLALPLTYFLTRRTGDIQRRLDGARQIRQLVVANGLRALLALVQLGVAASLMFVYSAPLAAVFLVVAPLYAALMALSARKLSPLLERLEESYGAYRSDQLDAIKGIEAVKTAASEGWFREKLLAQSQSVAQQQFRADFLVLAYQSALDALGFLAGLVFLYLAARLAIAGEMTIGGFVAFNGLVGMANEPIKVLLGLWDELQLSKILVRRLNDVVEPEPEQGHDHSRLLSVPSLAGAVTLRGVRFRYGGPSSTEILKGIDLDVQAGQTVALVGRSGSGKTTLAKLLGGLLVPTQGAILFDGVDQQTLELRELRRSLGFVLQENHVFSGTILENIALDQGGDLTRAMRAARLAGASDFIERLPLGLETRVGESGIALSGGQRQRLMIARAIYREPVVLVLDEATSALDAETERLIQENLETFFRGRTVFVIAHRLSTIRNADRIVVLEQGVVAEEGTHDELMARRGIYFYLVSRQLEQ